MTPPKRNPRFPPDGYVLPKGVKAVYVRWVDSATNRGWEQADVGKPTICHSVGIEVGRSDEAITLSTSFNGGSLYVDQLVIPLSAVQKISRIL